MTWPIISDDIVIQCAYELMREGGQSHNIADMLATQQVPGCMTDAVFNAGRVNGNQFEHSPEIGDAYRKRAEAAGVSTTGKYYHAGLATEPGDVRAWVSGRGDVQRRCEEEGWGCTGAVKVKGRERRPAPDIDVAEDLVMERVVDEMEKDPTQRVADVREKVKNRLKPRKMPKKRVA